MKNFFALLVALVFLTGSAKVDAQSPVFGPQFGPNGGGASFPSTPGMVCNTSSSISITCGATQLTAANVAQTNAANTFNSTQTVPTLKFSGGSSTITDNGANQGINFNPDGTFGAEFSLAFSTLNPQWGMNANGVMGFMPVSFCCNNPDTAISRKSAGVMALGTGLQGDVSGTLDLQQVNYTPKTITAGATPAISTASLQTITLSANATPTVTIATGEHLVLQICQPATGGPFTWTYPAAMHNGTTITSTAGHCTVQQWDSRNGTTLLAENVGQADIIP